MSNAEGYGFSPFFLRGFSSLGHIDIPSGFPPLPEFRMTIFFDINNPHSVDLKLFCFFKCLLYGESISDCCRGRKKLYFVNQPGCRFVKSTGAYRAASVSSPVYTAYQPLPLFSGGLQLQIAGAPCLISVAEFTAGKFYRDLRKTGAPVLDRFLIANLAVCRTADIRVKWEICVAVKRQPAAVRPAFSGTERQYPGGVVHAPADISVLRKDDFNRFLRIGRSIRVVCRWWSEKAKTPPTKGTKRSFS